MLQEVGTPQVEEPPDSGPGQLQRSVGTWGRRTETGSESADTAESVNSVACAVPHLGQGPENKQAKDRWEHAPLPGRVSRFICLVWVSVH